MLFDEGGRAPGFENSFPALDYHSNHSFGDPFVLFCIGVRTCFVLENIYSLSSSRDRSSQFAMLQLMNYDRKARHVTTPLTFKQGSKKGSNGPVRRTEKGKKRGPSPQLLNGSENEGK